MDNKEKNTWFDNNPKKTLTVILILLFFTIDFGAAAILKGLGLFTPSYTNAGVLEAHYRKAHTVYHHTLAPNIDYDHAEWGGKYYNIKTNSLGFKDSAVRNIVIRTSKKRIVFIGDSFTEGIGIEYPDTFTGLIDSKLTAKNIELLNASATSYSPIIYFRKIKYYIEEIGLKFDKLVVCIDLSDMEDESIVYTFDQNNNVIFSSRSGRYADAIQTTDKKQSEEQKKYRRPVTDLKEFFTQYTVITGRLRNLSKYLKAKSRSWKKSLDQRRGAWTVNEKLYNEYAREGLALSAMNMTRLKTLLDKHNIPLTIVIYPWPDQIWHHDLQSRQVSFWQDWSNKHNVELINLFPEFIKDDEDAEATIKKYFIRGDIHWNRAGHQKVANAILPRL